MMTLKFQAGLGRLEQMIPLNKEYNKSVSQIIESAI